MSDRKLAILGIVAAVMVVWAVVQTKMSGRETTEVATSTYLIQGLDPADIGSIVVTKDEDTVTLKRTGSGFVVEEKDGYPAKIKEINELIKTCLDIKTQELMTDNAANHADLEVTEETAQGVVRFFKADDELLTGVIIGKSREKGAGKYVRLVNDDRVYTTEEQPWIRSSAMDYIDATLTSVDREKVEWVKVAAPGYSYTLRKSEDGNAVMDELPAGKELDETEASSTLHALSSIRFEDVQKLKDTGAFAFDTTYECMLTDSTLYTLNIAKKEEKTYVQCTAKFTDTTPVTKEQGVESEEELKKKEAKLLARDEAQKFAAEHKGWVYQIADWRAEDLTATLNDLVKEPEPADPNAPAAE